MNSDLGSRYYRWRTTEVETRHGLFVVFDKPGMPRFGEKDVPASLLADEIESGPGETVLILNCGAGLAGLAAAAQSAHVIMTDANVVAVEAARRTAEANGLADRITVSAGADSPPSPPTLGGMLGERSNAKQVAHDPETALPATQSPASPEIGGRGAYQTTHDPQTARPAPHSPASPKIGGRGADQPTHDPKTAQPAPQSPASPKIGGRGAEHDIVAVLLPKGKAAALQSIWDAYRALKPGGYFYIAGANAEGAKTYIRYAEDFFGPIAVRAYRKGCRVGVAVKALEPQPLPARFQEPWLAHDYFRRFDVELREHLVHLCARPGVFSWDRLDAGTKALLDVMQIDVNDCILDLGCGCGIVGVTAAMLAPQGQVLMLDADINAVVSARETVAANGIENASVVLSDCGAAVEEADFDVVVTNPPFHQGKATQYDAAYQFIRDAARLLRPGGRFYLVANRFIPYEDAILDCLGEVETVYEDRRFKVLLGRQTIRQ